MKSSESSLLLNDCACVSVCWLTGISGYCDAGCSLSDYRAENNESGEDRVTNGFVEEFRLKMKTARRGRDGDCFTVH